MISLGEFDGYTLTVNQSNVESDKVTFHLYKDNEEKGYCREDCVYDWMFGPTPDEYLYVEAAKRYSDLGRPDAGDFDPNFMSKLCLDSEK